MDSDYFFEGFLSRENCMLVKLVKGIGLKEKPLTQTFVKKILGKKA